MLTASMQWIIPTLEGGSEREKLCSKITIFLKCWILLSVFSDAKNEMWQVMFYLKTDNKMTCCVYKT